jgi:flagellar protein FliL
MAAPAKADHPAKAEAKPDAKADAAAAPAAVAAPAAKGGIGKWLPAIVTVLLAPAATWAAVEFVVLPRLQKKIAATSSATPAEHGDAPAAHPAESGGHGSKGKGKDGKDAGAPGYEFKDIVVNLAGTMGTRYLKTSFLVTGADSKAEPNVKTVFEGAKPRLLDITNNILSTLTLADLEEPGSRNVIREKLVGAYNQALGRKVADQIYFSDFVIQ